LTCVKTGVHRGPRYFVSDSQRVEILAILTPRRPGTWQAVYWTVALLRAGVIAGSVWAFSGRVVPNAIGCVAVAALFMISLVAALLMWWQLRQLRPVLAGLPLTDEQVTPSDIRQTALNAVSFKGLLHPIYTMVMQAHSER
jgi:hypothetical protein